MRFVEVDGYDIKKVKRLAENLRDSDRHECQLLYGSQSYERLVISSCIVSHDKFIIESDNKDLFGVGGISNKCVWLVGTNNLNILSARKLLLSAGREYLRRKAEVYGRLYNYCSLDPMQLKAMRSLGFTIKEEDYKARIEICA